MADHQMQGSWWEARRPQALCGSRGGRPGLPSLIVPTVSMDVVVVVIVDRFYIVLFSALEQTHCARMRVYMDE